MTQTKPTIKDVTESLTGFDEIAIRQRFGGEFYDLAGSMPLRALVFIENRRNGMNDADAYKAAMGLTVPQATDCFGADSEESEGN